jgi:polyphosphate kinase
VCLDAAFSPDTAAWELQADDRWVRLGGARQVDYQEFLMRRLGGRAE